MMKSKDLCLALLAAESEADVTKVVEKQPGMGEPANWRPLDGRETNFNVTSNQASDGGKALTELMTNMVDAILLKSAYQKGLDPKSHSAPATMYEAVDKLIKNLHGGKLTALQAGDSWLSQYGIANLVIGVTGAKNKKQGLPCYTFMDNGEGQTGQRFESTFLSLSAGTKKEIQFVQGKYNMGSSGVLGYCGFRGYKLIVSRRFDQQHPWTWTLIRKRPNKGMPIYDYYMPASGIQTFDSEKLVPFCLANGTPFERLSWASGTAVKLYDYQIGNDFLSFRGSREALNENLIETILPFRILDFRQKPEPKKSGLRKFGIDERGFNGMEWLLLRTHTSVAISEADDENELPEDEGGEPSAKGEVSVGGITHPQLGEINVRAVVLKKGALPQWLKAPKHINRVFHAVHGQVQFKQTRGYLSDCGFPALKDRVVVFVDASNLTFEAHNGVWKADREHINNNFWGQLYKEQVAKLIRESQPLKDLQQNIAREELDSSASEQSVELFQRLLKEDKNLAALLRGTPPTLAISASGSRVGDTSTGTDFVGKHSPTFLRFEERVRSKTILIPINATRPIAATTDAVNDYFDRPDGPGKLVISEPAASRFSVRRQLKDGRMLIFLQPISAELSIGERIPIHASLKDPANEHLDVGDHCIVEIAAEEEKPLPKPKPPNPEPKPHPDTPGAKRGSGFAEPTLALPSHMFVTKDGRQIGAEDTEAWPDPFSEKEGGFVRDLGEGRLKFFINYDNAYHLAAKQRQRGDVAKAAITQKYKWGMLVLMMSFEQAYLSLSAEQKETLGEFHEQFSAMAARGAAATVLTIAEVLPKILNTADIDTE